MLLIQNNNYAVCSNACNCFSDQPPTKCRCTYYVYIELLHELVKKYPIIMSD